ncbi:MAG: hypothetical protein CMJ62_02595 [Planctomycetaceae bacterium]|nr:hypothetical protein [Planctomycetaceae bacterium]
MADKDDRKREKAVAGLEPIRSDAVYPLEVFKRCTGLGDWAIRTLRREGLTTTRIGNRRFVFGANFIRLIQAAEPDESQNTEE